jgi:glycosyltransferase involved in cell wall biosynthesis
MSAAHYAAPQAGIDPAGALHLIDQSGLFDVDYYVACNPDMASHRAGAMAHYHAHGWREGRKPNLYFDPRWYLAQQPDVAKDAIDPLLHYLLRGEAEGRRPSAWFDPTWYRATYTVPEGMHALRHYLLNRAGGAVSAMAEFDSPFYLRTYPDVAEAGLDPLEHYMVQGFRESRRPFAGFDPAFYRQRYLDGETEANPLLHYMAHRGRPGVHPALPAGETTIAREVRRNTQPGPFFETRRPLPATAARRARVLAYYLPQFHAMKRNDEWWGEGFTEWTNVARGLPRFAGHYQPRVPRDLGHYRLEGTDVLRRQAEMARSAGIDGFVFYFYWFNRERLLDGPLEALLADPSIDLPFCLMWANENWTRRWDGSEEDILISQDFRAEDELPLIDCFARHFADPRYIRVGGRPVLMIYRIGLIPDAAETVARWRTLFQGRTGEDPLFVMSQSFGDNDPRPYGLDGAIEFPPHKLVGGLQTINTTLNMLDTDFTGQVYDYDEIVQGALAEPPSPFPQIRTASPSWDNDARRQGSGLVLHGATPAKYETWLEGLVRHASAHPFHGEAIVCVNAWNEWAEGAYLEPDLHFGSAYLNATGRAVTGFGRPSAQGRILLVGHDAFQAGAQSLLLHVGRQLKRGHGVEIAFLLLGGGALRDGYESVGRTTVMDADDPRLPAHLETLRNAGFSGAIVNSSASAPVGPRLARAGIPFILLVHELPALLGEKNLLPALRDAAARAARTVFPAAAVHDAVRALVPIPDDRAVQIAQGLYAGVRYSPRHRTVLRAQFGVEASDLLLIGIGYADMRKGFDLFLQAWRLLSARSPGGRRRHRRIHCLWLGAIDPGLHTYLRAEIETAIASGTFHMPGHVPDAPDHLSAADAFMLTSREDPLPSVVMEALAAGLPVVAFENSGGTPELLRRFDTGALAPLGDVASLARQALALAQHCHDQPAAERAKAGRAVAKQLCFDRYVGRLLSLTQPALRRISVVVPSFNYARYMRQRLASIFAQGHPVLEVIVLDDASADDSVAEARAAAADWDRQVRVVAQTRNSGSVFRQWQRAVAEARGDWIWIAEADDAADPRLLETLAQALDGAPRAVMAFCDSRAVDSAGATVSDSYKSYYATTAGTTLDADGLHEGPAFVRTCLSERNLILNASGVLFERHALKAALARLGEELLTFRVAGDWRLYIELLNQPGAQIVYVAEPLNIHRRHAGSTTHRLAAQKHLGEVARIHRLIGKQPAVLDADRMRQRAYRSQLAQQFGLKLAGE